MLALKKFKFDVLFSGDDWKGSARYLRTEKQFAEYGASIEYLSYDYVNNSSILVDYIHDDSVLKQLSNNSDTIGFLLYAIDKKSLFQGIIKDGALPRKTFSMLYFSITI